MNTSQIKKGKFYKEFSNLIGSLKNVDSEDILIGRSHKTEIFPNDISNNPFIFFFGVSEDKIISRIYCKLVCKNYFRKEQKIKLIYKLAISTHLILHYLKNSLKDLLILEFPKYAYVQDLGSLCGTHLKIFKNEPNIIKYDQKYSIGNDTHFNQIYKEEGIEIDDQLILKTQCSEEDNEEFKINTELYIEIIQSSYYIDQIQWIWFRNRKSFQYFYSFYLNQDCQIGIDQENHIQINSNTISRKQSGFNYSKSLKSWIIFDGSKDRDSANEQAEKKNESDLMVLKTIQKEKLVNLFQKLNCFRESKKLVNIINFIQKIKLNQINQQFLNELKK